MRPIPAGPGQTLSGGCIRDRNTHNKFFATRFAHFFIIKVPGVRPGFDPHSALWPHAHGAPRANLEKVSQKRPRATPMAHIPPPMVWEAAGVRTERIWALSPDSPSGRRGREAIVLSGEPWANLGHFNYKKVRKTRREKFVTCVAAPNTSPRKRLARARRNRPHDGREVSPTIQASD